MACLKLSSMCFLLPFAILMTPTLHMCVFLLMIILNMSLHLSLAMP